MTHFHSINNQYLATLNTATKYPSIDTFHVLDRGKATDETNNVVKRALEIAPGAGVEFTEKIDGTNCRILFFPNIEQNGRYAYMIGSREELLFASGDFLFNSQLGIVKTASEHLDWINRVIAGLIIQHQSNTIGNIPMSWTLDDVIVVYGEVYGGKIGKNARTYSNNPEHSAFKVFDVARFPKITLDALVKLSLSDVALWREKTQCEWVTNDFKAVARHLFPTYYEHMFAPNVVVPGIEKIRDLPLTKYGIRDILYAHSKKTLCSIVGESNRLPEGLIVRAKGNRKNFIAKIRNDDYNL